MTRFNHSPPQDRPRDAETDISLRREHRRLRRAFTALIASLAPVIAVEACGHPPTDLPPGDMTSTGGGLGDDAGDQAEANADAPPDAVIDDAAADRDCTMRTTPMDAGNDGEDNCIVTMPCGLPPYINVADCKLYGPDDASLGCEIVRGEGCAAHVFVPAPPGAVQIYCLDCLGGGRRPRGLERARGRGAPTALGAYFARMAHDEAASVRAFRRLADELARHGAPAPLVFAAQRSARDEERHARVMARRARLHKAPILTPRVRTCGPRALSTIARENAVEGCVRETFGALLLAFQAAHATDAPLRRTLARVAADEARHAALSWAVARWAEARLSPGARARIARARGRAIAALLRPAPRAAFDAAIGRPAPDTRAALLKGMIHALGL